jgi:16S rRNA (adenine1518-N6/adenine1519-N6)-dimethyltransferase
MRPNKRLGQHFLRDAGVLQEINAVADVSRASGALEIGPGEGALTAFLVQSGRPIIALEKDERAVDILRKRFGDKVTLVLGDAITLDLASLLPPADESGRLPVVVGNLPYNVGTAIFRKLLMLRGRVSRLVLMLQREVAARIVAGPGSKSYGLLSVVTAQIARSWMILEVPPSAFIPPPKVHSGVILVDFDCPAQMQLQEMDAFMNFLGRIFRARRKTLANALKDKELIESVGLNPNIRPEAVTPSEFMHLYALDLSRKKSAGDI